MNVSACASLTPKNSSKAVNVSILTLRIRFTESIRRSAGRLDHPNIVPIHEIGEHQGQHFFTMRFIEGGNLAGLIAKKFTTESTESTERKKELKKTSSPSFSVVSVSSVVKLLVLVARAVHHAHQRGILHRDLKPSNILLDGDGEPHVSDFGLARRLEGDARLTQSGALVGTPSYMAPEQALGRKAELTVAADVYSLGAILYEMLTGRPPFQAETPLETVLQGWKRPPNDLPFATRMWTVIWS